VRPCRAQARRAAELCSQHAKPIVTEEASKAGTAGNGWTAGQAQPERFGVRMLAGRRRLHDMAANVCHDS